MSGAMLQFHASGTLSDLSKVFQEIIALGKLVNLEGGYTKPDDVNAVNVLMEANERIAVLEGQLAEANDKIALHEEAAKSMALTISTLRDEVSAYRDACDQADAEAASLRKELKALKAGKQPEPSKALATIQPVFQADLPKPNASAAEQAPSFEPAKGPVAPLPEKQPQAYAPAWTQIGGARQMHAEYIATVSPTTEEMMVKFGCSRQSVQNKVFALNTAFAGRFRFKLNEHKRYVIVKVEKPAEVEKAKVHIVDTSAPAQAIPVKAPEKKPAVVPKPELVGKTVSAGPSMPKQPQPADSQSLPAPTSEKIQGWNICQVNILLLTVTGPKGAARITSSNFAKVLQHMADGGLFGLDRLVKQGGYPTVDALKLAFTNHRDRLGAIGLSIYVDKINAGLRVIA